MKRRLQKHLALMLALCMCLSVCPVAAAAEDAATELKIEAVTATAQPLDSAANDPVTLTTASVIPQQSSFYVKFDGLEFNGEYRILVQTGSYSSYNYLYAYINEPMVESMYYNLPLGSNTFTLTICDDDKNPLYQPVTLTTQVVENVPVTVEELQAGAEPREISTLETSFSALTYLPLGTLASSEGLSFDIVKDGVVYAVTTEDSYCRADNTTQRDPRYDEIFDEYTYVPLKAQTPQGSVYCGRELVPGSYDLRMYLNGELYTTHEDAIICYDTPIVSYNYSNGAAGAYNVKKSELAACVLRITNGDPADFEVTMLKDDEKIGTSEGYRTLANYSDGDIVVLYYVPVDEPLEDRTYHFKITHKDGADFVLQDDQPSTYAQKQAMDDYLAQFGSYYYANFVMAGAGYDAGVQYEFELMLYDDVIATTKASPNNDGIFNVEFRDEDGQLIELLEDEEYEVCLYSENQDWPDASWYFYNYNLWREEPLSLMSADTYTLEVTGANTYRVDGDQFYVWLRSDEETIANLDTSAKNYKLQMTSAIGETTVLSCASVTAAAERAQLYFDIPSGMENVYYLPALLYKDKLVVNTEGTNILKKSYLTENSSAPSADISGSYISEVSVNLRIEPMNLYGSDVTVDFYSLDNRTAEADLTVTLSAEDDYELTADMLEGLNPAAKYMTVMSVDGVSVSCSGEFEYWTAPERVWNNDYENCDELTVAEGMEDYLEIVPCYTNYDEEEGLLCFSEVYVNVTAPEGKALQYITVNGEKICGNGFLFTEDCVVSAIFEEAETETYKATVQMGIQEWVYGNGMTEEELDKYLETLSPEEAEAFLANGGAGEGSWKFKVLHSYERNFPPNSMNELDLSLPAELSKYKISYTDVECSDPTQWSNVSHDGTGTRWSLRMPECDVLVKVELQKKQNYHVSVQYDSSMGAVAGFESDYVYVTEGETVSFTATPNEGNLLQTVYYEYYDYRNGGEQHIELTPDADGVYSFVMPYTSVSLYVTFTTSGPYEVTADAYGLGTVELSQPESEAGYMGGDVVTLTVTPDEGSRLVRKNAITGSYTIGYQNHNLTFTKVDEQTYTFVVPQADVYIEVRYEIAPATAPGGIVTDNDTLIVALGGAENAALNADTGAVQLLQNVELLSPIVFNPAEVTEFIFDLNGKRMIAVEENTQESGAIILHYNGLARVKLDSTHTSQKAVITTDELPRNNFHLIWVQGGQLTIEPQKYIFFYGAHSYQQNRSAVIRVAGGAVELVKNFEMHGNGTGDAVWASGGTTNIHAGSYFGGVDYYNQMAGELELLGGLEEYDWVTNRSLGGNGIHVSGKAQVNLHGENIWSKGGPNGAALYIDNNVSVDTPCVVNVYEGSYEGDYGKGLLVQSAYADLTIYGGEFRAGYPDNADYSVDVRNCGVVADYLAPDRKVENLDRYLGYEAGKNIYEQMTEEDLQRSYLYDSIRVSESSAIVANKELDKVMESTDAAEIQAAVESVGAIVLKEALVAEPDENSEEDSVADKLQRLEEKLNVSTSVEADAVIAEVFPNADLSMIGAAFNVDEQASEVKLTVSAQQGEAKPSAAQYSDSIQFSMNLSGAKDADAYTAGQQLKVPVLLTMPVPEGINPALLTVLHYDEAKAAWEELDLRVYQDEQGKWFVAFTTNKFSDYAMTNKLVVRKDGQYIGVTVDVASFAKEDTQFLCAAYSEQGQMMGMTIMSAANKYCSIALGDKIDDVHAVKVFFAGTDGKWTPKYDVKTIVLP